MPRLLLPFHSDDISALARSLKSQLAELGSPPSHLQLLNMLARASGSRNFQQSRVTRVVRKTEPAPAASAKPAGAMAGHEEIAPVRVQKLLRVFDREGRLLRWPPKRSQQQLCLWVLWSRVPPGQVIAERELNALLNMNHHFGDHALLRRWMCDYGMMTRTADGREYRRVEQHPPAERREPMRQLRAESPRPPAL